MIVFLFFISCTDSTDFITVAAPSTAIVSRAAVGPESFPENSLNPNDYVGQVYSELFDDYYDGSATIFTLDSVSKRVTFLANENPNFISFSGFPYLFSSKDKAAYLLADGSTAATVASSLETIEAKQQLNTFISSLLPLYATEETYGVLHSFIVSFESDVLTSQHIGVSDKKIILTTTSIIRYAVYKSKKRPKKNTDPEWDLMVWAIIGGVEGRTESIEDAVVLSLICGVVSNSN
ncbi:hypothetical protein ACFSX9_04300 [Flavobacterium ardleyense]|uniref:Lipoprotein n=1 Tax=Flavobacterium ardleyense TaxID=2038737 RepID=A0ABW5Z555_9FLAO